MVCTICGKNMEKGHSIRGGYICDTCYNCLPKSCKLHIQEFDKIQIKRLLSICKENRDTFYTCGNFKMGDRWIKLSEITFDLHDIKKIKLKFHPRELVGSKVKGYATVCIEFVNGIQLEEQIKDEMYTVSYKYDGKKLTYIPPEPINSALDFIQDSINEGRYDVSSVRIEYEKSEAFKKQQEQRQRQWQEEQNRRKKEENRKNKSITLSQAKQLFNISGDYTKDEIKKKRNALLKKYHPDNQGGSTQLCSLINEVYQLLLDNVS